MNQSIPQQISVHGSARIQQRPGTLLMARSLKSSAATLELALERLNNGCDAVSTWLNRLGAQSIEFGHPRFPDQIEDTPMQRVRRNSRVEKVTNENDTGEKSVVVSYVGRWAIDQMSSDEVLILVDRLQFETADETADELEKEKEDSEQEVTWKDQFEKFQSVIASMHESPDDNETHIVFLSKLTSEKLHEGIQKAIENGREQADAIAATSGLILEELKSVNTFLNLPNPSVDSQVIMSMESSVRVLTEAGFSCDSTEIISKSPRAVYFGFGVSMVFETH